MSFRDFLNDRANLLESEKDVLDGLSDREIGALHALLSRILFPDLDALRESIMLNFHMEALLAEPELQKEDEFGGGLLQINKIGECDGTSLGDTGYAPTITDQNYEDFADITFLDENAIIEIGRKINEEISANI